MTLIALSLLVLSSASAMATVADQEYVSVSCRDARNIADDGYMVEIHQGGFTGKMRAEVSRQTFGGPVLLSSVFVKQIGSPVIFDSWVSYVGRNFNLMIQTDVANHNGENYAHLRTRIGNRTIDQEMFCRFLTHIQ